MGDRGSGLHEAEASALLNNRTKVAVVAPVVVARAVVRGSICYQKIKPVGKTQLL